MQHILYVNGNPRQIAWVIQTEGKTVKETREQADIYFDKVTNEQAKFIALHVGIFWSIGVFIIKNNDSITVKLSSEPMYRYLTSKQKSTDDFVNQKMKFINQLIKQRSLDVKYEMIITEEDLASKLI